MGKVINLFPPKKKKKDDDGCICEIPTGTGEAFCIHCNHEWEATAKVGEAWLECPECRTYKGVFKFQYMPPGGGVVWECRCKNQLFYVTPSGTFCPNCGIFQNL